MAHHPSHPRNKKPQPPFLQSAAHLSNTSFQTNTAAPTAVAVASATPNIQNMQLPLFFCTSTPSLTHTYDTTASPLLIVLFRLYLLDPSSSHRLYKRSRSKLFFLTLPSQFKCAKWFTIWTAFAATTVKCSAICLSIAATGRSTPLHRLKYILA